MVGSGGSRISYDSCEPPDYLAMPHKSVAHFSRAIFEGADRNMTPTLFKLFRIVLMSVMAAAVHLLSA
jgi:hypothetical protein